MKNRHGKQKAPDPKMADPSNFKTEEMRSPSLAGSTKNGSADDATLALPESEPDKKVAIAQAETRVATDPAMPDDSVKVPISQVDATLAMDPNSPLFDDAGHSIPKHIANYD